MNYSKEFGGNWPIPMAILGPPVMDLNMTEGRSVAFSPFKYRPKYVIQPRNMNQTWM